MCMLCTQGQLAVRVFLRVTTYYNDLGIFIPGIEPRSSVCEVYAPPLSHRAGSVFFVIFENINFTYIGSHHIQTQLQKKSWKRYRYEGHKHDHQIYALHKDSSHIGWDGVVNNPAVVNCKGNIILYRQSEISGNYHVVMVTLLWITP